MPDDNRNSPNPDDYQEGFIVQRAPDGHVVITLRNTADPAKASLEWLAARRADMPDDVAFRREYLLDWTSAEGSPFFPAFAQDPQRYIDPTVRIDPKLPVIRGWDFGHRKPACVWMQAQGPHVVVSHALLPEDIDIYSFRDLVMFLSGQSLRLDKPDASFADEINTLRARPRAMHFLQQLQESDPWFPEGDPAREPTRVPFFPPGLRFLDFSGHEAVQKTQFETTKSERSAMEVLAAAGCHLEWSYQPESYGENITRKLLLDVKPGVPGLRIHPRAAVLIEGFAGGLVYAPDTAARIGQEKMRDDGHFINVFDAWMYGVINVANVADNVPQGPAAAAAPTGPGIDFPAARGRRPLGRRPQFHNGLRARDRPQRRHRRPRGRAFLA